MANAVIPTGRDFRSNVEKAAEFFGTVDARSEGAAYNFVNPEAGALSARFTIPASNVRNGLIDTLVGALKTTGAWAKFDVFWAIGADSQASTRNWVADQYNLVLTSSPTFTADRGFKGDAAAARFAASGYNPSTTPGNLLLNDASEATWVRTAATALINAIDLYTSTGRLSRNGADATKYLSRMNDANSLQVVPVAMTGLWSTRRAASNAKAIFKDGASVGTDASASTTVAILAQWLGTTSNFSDAELSAGWVGASLTDQQMADVYSALHTYLVAIGATS